MHYNAREILKRSCNFRSVNLYVCDKRDHIRDHCLMIECLLYFYAMRRKLLIDRYVTLREKQTLRVEDYNSKYLFLHVKQVSIDPLMRELYRYKCDARVRQACRSIEYSLDLN